MTYALRVLFILALIIPASSLAQSGSVKPPQCFMTSATNPTGSKSFNFLQQKEVDAYKQYLEASAFCPSACFDEVITTTFEKNTVTIKVTATNKCTQQPPTRESAAADKRGCTQGLTKPSLKITTVGSGLPQPDVKSRCDVEGISKATNASKSENRASALRMISLDAVQNADLNTETGRRQSSEVLKAFGINANEADALVRDRPDEAKALLTALARGNKEEIQEAVNSAGVTLNSNINDIVNLKPEDQAKKFSALYSDDQKQSLDNILAQNTGFDAGPSQLEKSKCAIATIESGSCSGDYSRLGPWTRKGRAYGKYQVMDFNIPSWTRRACGQAMNPYQFLQDSTCQEQVFEKYFTAHVQSCNGSYERAAAKWFSGSCAVTNATDGWTSVGKYVSKFSRVFGSDGPLPYGAGRSIYTSGSSPFAQVNPFSSGGYNSNVVCTGSGYCYLANDAGITMHPAPIGTVAPTQPAASTPQASPQTPPVSPPGTSSAPPPAVASLLVQPRTVTKGTTVSVSWSSVGMSTEMPCQVFTGTSFFAQGNEGSRVFETKSVAASTSVPFILQCFSKAGMKVQQETSVLVR